MGDDGKLLVAGATGYIGRLLSLELAARGGDVRCLVRNRSRADDLAAAGCEIVQGDVLDPATLRPALEGVSVAYYLVHSMGRGGDAKFATRDRRAAENFATAAAEAGVELIVYLGGLTEGGSEHLASRHETARVLQASGVPLTYFRAAAVIGAGSESFRLTLYLTRRLPVMITPSWTATDTQPIAIGDVLRYLLKAPEVPEAHGREIEIGGPDVTTYAGMIDACAEALDLPRRWRIPVPVLSPWLSSLWVGLVTPVDVGVARPLIEGAESETVVSDPSGMKLFEVSAMSLSEAMRAAVEEARADGA
ncbi:MAG: NAD(P)H-binding protein [bacterium]